MVRVRGLGSKCVISGDHNVGAIQLGCETFTILPVVLYRCQSIESSKIKMPISISGR
jgi:hypothetical protein